MNLKLIVVIFGLLYILYDISNTIEGLENGGEDGEEGKDEGDGGEEGKDEGDGGEEGNGGDGGDDDGTNWTLIIIAIVVVGGLLIGAGILYYKKKGKTVNDGYPDESVKDIDRWVYNRSKKFKKYTE